VCRCGPGGRWWQPTTGSMTMHAVYNLQADCLESRISSGPLLSITSMGTLYLFSGTQCDGQDVYSTS